MYNNNSYQPSMPYGNNFPMNNMMNRPVPNQYLDGRDERFGGFFVPFLLGGLTGGAAVAVSRPRPVYVNQAPYPYYPPYYGPRPY